VRQPQKLASYPAFDQLWLRVLGVLSALLGGGGGPTPGPGGAAAGAAPGGPFPSQSLAPAVITAQHCLLKCIRVLTSGGLLEDRKGLRQVTKEMVRAMALVPGLDDGDAHSDSASKVLSRLLG